MIEVIFLQNVKGVAKIGEVKKVADGYARNFLLPKGLVEVATSAKVAALKATLEQRVAAETAEAEADVERVRQLDGQTIQLAAKANPKGGLFAAITAEDIVRALPIKLDAEQITIFEPIKKIGQHQIEVRAGEATAKITVDVKAE